MAKEKLFENKIKRWLDNHNCWYVKFFANAFTKAGVPDLLCCVNGKFVAIEVKADNGHPSELQLYHKSMIEKSHGYCIIAYPKDYDKLIKDMEDILNG